MELLSKEVYKPTRKPVLDFLCRVQIFTKSKHSSKFNGLALFDFYLPKESESVGRSIMSDSLRLPMDYCPPASSCAWNFPGKDTVATPFSREFSFDPQGSNPGLLHCRQILYHLSPFYLSKKVKFTQKSKVWMSCRTFKIIDLRFQSCESPNGTCFFLTQAIPW